MSQILTNDRRAEIATQLGMKPREIAGVESGPADTVVVTTFEGAQTVVATTEGGQPVTVAVGQRTGPDHAAVFAAATHAREQRVAATEAELEQAKRLVAAENARVEAERLAAEGEAARLEQDDEARARAQSAAQEASKAEHATEPATATDAPRARGRQGR